MLRERFPDFDVLKSVTADLSQPSLAAPAYPPAQGPFLWLLCDTGPQGRDPKMREHLVSVTTIMKLSDEYDDFEVKLDRVHPRYDETLGAAIARQRRRSSLNERGRQLRQLWN